MKRDIKILYRKISILERKLEQSNLQRLLELLDKPLRLIWSNILLGVARGFGIAIGVTLVGSVFLLFLGRLVELNLPVIGEFLAELLQLIETERDLMR